VIDVNDDTVLQDEPDDLAAALERAAPRRWWNRGTLVLGAVALVLVGVLGGALTQKQWGTGATSAAARPAGLGNGGRFAAGGGAPAPSPSAAGTSGTVKLVDGNTIYLQAADGTVVTVRTDGKTSVRTATRAGVKDVKAGDTVTVQGPAAADGTVTATTVIAERK
jgi:hypothetical protein